LDVGHALAEASSGRVDRGAGGESLPPCLTSELGLTYSATAVIGARQTFPLESFPEFSSGLAR